MAFSIPESFLTQGEYLFCVLIDILKYELKFITVYHLLFVEQAVKILLYKIVHDM